MPEHDPELGPSGCSIAILYLWGVASSLLWVFALVAIFTIPTTSFERVVVILLTLLLVSVARGFRDAQAQLGLMTQFLLANIKATAELTADEASAETIRNVEQINFELTRATTHGQRIGKITGFFDGLGWLIIMWQLLVVLFGGG